MAEYVWSDRSVELLAAEEAWLSGPDQYRHHPRSSSDDALMDFQVSPEIAEMVRGAAAFADRVADGAAKAHPHLFGEDAEVRSIGPDGRLVPEIFDIRASVRREARELGLYGAYMPEEVGGRGLPCLTMSLLEEAIAARPAFPQVFWPDLTIHVLGRAWGPTPTLLGGSDHIRRRYLEPLMAGSKTTCIALTDPTAGSDPQNMRSSGVRTAGGWLLNATKLFVGNGPYADFIMLYVRTSGEPGEIKGISLFVVDRTNPGFRVEHVQKVMEGSGNHGRLIFEDCEVPAEDLVGEEGQGFKLAMQYVSAARLSIAARCLGASQWLLDTAIAYAKTRQTFGAPLADRQAIQWMIADLATEIEELRWLVRYAAWKVDSGASARRETAMAKLRGPHVYHRAADVAMQVHGGIGYTAALPIERAYRRARGYRFIEGTDEMQRRSLAAELLR